MAERERDWFASCRAICGWRAQSERRDAKPEVACTAESTVRTVEMPREMVPTNLNMETVWAAMMRTTRSGEDETRIVVMAACAVLWKCCFAGFPSAVADTDVCDAGTAGRPRVPPARA